MYSKEAIKGMLFLDVETVSSHKDLNAMEQEDPDLLSFWPDKASLIRKGKPEIIDLTDSEVYEKESALYTEFSKIVTISIGQVVFDEAGEPHFKVKSYQSHNERDILEGFWKAINALFNKYPGLKLVGHNITGFDLPLILRKFIKYDLEIPRNLMLHDIKPWESCMLDTSKIWKFGSWTGAPLGLLCTSLGIPSPKNDLSGSKVTDAYWNRNELERITTYCEADVKATANVILKMSRLPLCY
tara:strand:- start:3843 stop:4568 length:726 start_codon:yes stop_codon:yes gene_type:complete